jgi:hypothetical protein
MKHKVGDYFKSTSHTYGYWVIKIKRIIPYSALPYVCEVIKQRDKDSVCLEGIVTRQSENSLNKFKKLSDEQAMVLLL